MAFGSCDPCFLVGGVFLGGHTSRATNLLFAHPGGGPLEYNGDSSVSVAFDLPDATRIESISAWINGQGDHAVEILRTEPINGFGFGFSKSFSCVQVDAPVKWQGVGSLNWDLAPGSSTLFLRGGFIPYGYGSTEPLLTPLYDISDFREYDDDALGSRSEPFGIKVSGSPLSAVPEPATCGVMGILLLCLVSIARALKRRHQNPA